MNSLKASLLSQEWLVVVSRLSPPNSTAPQSITNNTFRTLHHITKSVPFLHHLGADDASRRAGTTSGHCHHDTPSDTFLSRAPWSSRTLSTNTRLLPHYLSIFLLFFSQSSFKSRSFTHKSIETSNCQTDQISACSRVPTTHVYPTARGEMKPWDRRLLQPRVDGHLHSSLS